MSKKVAPDFGDGAGPSLHAANWRFGEFELDESQRELRRLGEVVAIEPKPLNLLMLMLRHPGELLTKNDLIEAVWPGRILTDAVLGNCVAKLRAVLGAEAAAAIKTMHGYGYRFDAVAELLPNTQASIAAPKLSLNVGDQIPQRPNWQLLRRLGRSGDSWLAEHIKTHVKRVFKFTAEPRGLSALKREVTIFRLMRESLGEKVCYVELLDWNFDAPPWFIESEYCAAGSLEEWFEAQGGVGKVSLATRIELVAQIAEALAEVHLIGVLHKDLKPANIFVVLGEHGQPEIRLADFGSGRLLDAAHLQALMITQMGFTQVIDHNDADSGTLLYLAPEVLAGQPATVKADLYALGVILYQCAVGSLGRRMSTGWEQDIADELLSEDIAVATNGNPERRLADAGELARSLRSLEARRITRESEREAAAEAERAARALERLRARRIGMRVAFAALTVGFIVSAALYVQARQARVLAEKSATRANAISKFLGTDLLANVSTDTRQVQKLTVKEVLDSAASQVDKRFAADPVTASEVHLSLSDSYWALDYVGDACEQAERVLAISTPLTKDNAGLSVRAAAKLVIRSHVHGTLVAMLPKILSLSEQSMLLLSTDNPDQLALRVELLRGRYFLGQWNEAVAAAETLLPDLEHLHQRDYSKEVSVDTLLGLSMLSLGDEVRAESLLSKAVTMLTNQPGTSKRRLAQAQLEWAQALTALGRTNEAERELHSALEVVRDWDGTISGSELYARTSIGRVRLAQGRLQEARDILEKEVTDAEKFFEGNTDQIQRVPGLLALAEAYQRLGQPDSAERTLRNILTLASLSANPTHLRYRQARLRLIELLVEENHPDSARRELEMSPMLTFNDLPDTHPANLRLRDLVSMLVTRLKGGTGDVNIQNLAGIGRSLENVRRFQLTSYLWSSRTSGEQHAFRS